MAEKFEITSEMKEKIGWQSDPWTFEVTRTSIRAFARGVGYTDQVYFDVAEAKKAGYSDLPAPSTYLGTAIFIPGKSNDNLPFPPGFRVDLNHGLPGLLDGGGETEYFEPILAGDELVCVNRLAKLETKDSKALGTMLIQSNVTTFTNQHGQVAAIQHSQAIYY